MVPAKSRATLLSLTCSSITCHSPTPALILNVPSPIYSFVLSVNSLHFCLGLFLICWDASESRGVIPAVTSRRQQV